MGNTAISCQGNITLSENVQMSTLLQSYFQMLLMSTLWGRKWKDRRLRQRNVQRKMSLQMKSWGMTYCQNDGLFSAVHYFCLFKSFPVAHIQMYDISFIWVRFLKEFKLVSVHWTYCWIDIYTYCAYHTFKNKIIYNVQVVTINVPRYI